MRRAQEGTVRFQGGAHLHTRSRRQPATTRGEANLPAPGDGGWAALRTSGAAMMSCIMLASTRKKVGGLAASGDCSTNSAGTLRRYGAVRRHAVQTVQHCHAGSSDFSGPGKARSRCPRHPDVHARCTPTSRAPPPPGSAPAGSSPPSSSGPASAPAGRAPSPCPSAAPAAGGSPRPTGSPAGRGSGSARLQAAAKV